MGEYDPLIAKVRTARILTFLVKKGISTVKEITKYLGNITENALYRYMRKLVNQGLVVEMGWSQEREYGKGRSAKLYKAAEYNLKVNELVRFLE